MKTFLKIIKRIAIISIIITLVITAIRFVNGRITKNREAVKESTLANPLYKEINDKEPEKSVIPQVSVTKVVGDYMNGYHLIPDQITRKGTVVTFGGSEGSSNFIQAAQLAKEGYEVYAMHFFGQENQQKELVRVPLEFFEEVYAEIERNAVSAKPLTILGGSKGAELCLLLANKYPDMVDNVVLYAPSAYVFQGLSNDYSLAQSSWTSGGVELPYVSFQDTAGATFAKFFLSMMVNMPMQFEPTYRSMLENAKNLEEAKINTQDAKANLLIFTGGKDVMWPSPSMAQTIVADYPAPSRLEVYDEAGHLFFGPAVIENMVVGGEYEANEAAKKDSDQKLLDALQEWTK